MTSSPTSLAILILGGTRFVGRALVEYCSAQGHHVTLFNRGLTNPDLFPDVETVIGNRTDPHAFAALEGRTFDVVIDVAAYTPQAARIAVQALADSTSRYVFISTRSVYAGNGGLHDETSDVLHLDPALPAGEGSYGARKAACEEVIREALGDRSLIVRPGMIVGPHDGKDRFAYWPRRFARGGRLIAPGSPADHVQWIDVRDLAAWTMTSAIAGLAGIFNLVGEPVPMRKFTAACRDVTHSDANMVWIPSTELHAAGLTPSTAAPLWIAGTDVINVAKARAAGLRTRALHTTLADVLAWDTARGGPPAGQEGLAPGKEYALLSQSRFNLQDPSEDADSIAAM